MIREFRHTDMEPLLALWLESTICAHPFIPESYWYESEAVVRDIYLPAARTWVWDEEGALKGFVSVMEQRFLGALFVAPDTLRSGIGKALVQHVQRRFDVLSEDNYQGYVVYEGRVRAENLPEAYRQSLAWLRTC